MTSRAYVLGLSAYRTYRLFSSPERMRMRSTVRRWVRLCPPGAVLLEVGGGTSMLRHVIETEVQGIRYFSGDIAPTDRSDLAMDAQTLPIRTASLDAVMALEVLEHMPRPSLMLCEASRVLKDDGLLILTTPFMYGVHDFRDYFRYTPDGLADLLRPCHVELHEVVLRGGTFVSVAGLLRNLVRDRILGQPVGWRARGRQKKALWLAATAVTAPWVPVMWLALALDSALDRDSKSPPGYFFLCRRLPRPLATAEEPLAEHLQRAAHALTNGGTATGGLA